MENLISHLMGYPWGLFCRGVFSVNFEYMVTLFLKVNKIFNRLIYYLTIFGNFRYFKPWGAPRGDFLRPPPAIPPPPPLCAAVLWLSPLLFLILFGVRNIWAKFHAFITICMILVISCASGLEKKHALRTVD